MELRQVLGNTWVLEDWLMIPLYRLDARRAILLDSGDWTQREAIEQVLSKAGIIPVGIIGTHAHTDHSPNHAYFQRKYGLPVAMSLGEAGISSSQLMLKAYFYMLSPKASRTAEDILPMEVVADRIILPGETELNLCGATFGIVHTPGHSPDHISIRTPDGVLYLGDALLTEAEITASKLPYFFSLADALETLDALRRQTDPCYIAAHRGIYSDITPWIDENRSILNARCAEIRQLIDRPMTMDQIYQVVCRHFRLLSAAPGKGALYERNIRVYVEHLRDTEQIDIWGDAGLVWYGPKSR